MSGRRPSVEVNQRVNNFTRSHLRDRLIDLFELCPMRNKTQRIESARLDHPDDPRNIEMRPASAAFRAGKHFAMMQRQRVERDLLVVRHYAEENAAAFRGCQLVACFDDLRRAGPVDGYIRATPTYDLPDGIAHVRVAAIDRMGSAYFARLGQLMVE